MIAILMVWIHLLANVLVLFLLFNLVSNASSEGDERGEGGNSFKIGERVIVALEYPLKDEKIDILPTLAAPGLLPDSTPSPSLSTM